MDHHRVGPLLYLRTFARRVLAILDGRNVAVFGATLLSPVV
jgi:hypothetical protein